MGDLAFSFPGKDPVEFPFGGQAQLVLGGCLG